jgi:hypothetical protein
MKITVDLSDKDLREISRVTGEKKKGPAIRKFVLEELMMRRRRQFVEKCISGEFGLEFKDYERGQKLERKAAERMDALWRD